MNARAEILAAVRAAVEGGAEAVARVNQRLQARTRNLIPARAKGSAQAMLEGFIERARRVETVVTRASDAAAAVDAIGDYLRRENLGLAVAMAPDPYLASLPWGRIALMDARRGGAAIESDRVSVTSAFAAIAETGTLMLRSGPEHPSTLNFVPATHIVVLPSDRIVGALEDALDRLRADGAALPATVNLITGPSRSADIEQTILLGAHGPQRLMIVVVGDAA